MIAGVVVGRDRLRVRVNHNRLVPRLFQREGGLTAAIVEFDSLPNTVGTSSQNHDAVFASGWACLVLRMQSVNRAWRFVVVQYFLTTNYGRLTRDSGSFISGVVIRSERLKFGSAGVDELINGGDSLG